LSDLQGRKVAVMKGDNAEEFLRREERGLHIHTTKTFKEALLGLSRKEYDAVIVQRIVGLRLIQELGLENLRVVSKPIFGFRQDFCFAVKEGDRETLALLNEGLSLVIADGTYRYLHARWFSPLELPSRRHIIVGGDFNFPPFEYLDRKGNPAGFNVDLVKAIAREMDLDVEINLGPWPEITQGLLLGNIDVIQGMFYSPERDLQFDFTQPHTMSHYVTVVRKGSMDLPESVDELKSLTIGVQDGDIMHEFAVENGLSDRVVPYYTQESALKALRQGEVDCALIARQTVLYYIDLYNWENLSVGQHPFITLEYCFAVQQNDRALLNKFSEGLTILEKTGEYRKIYDKWLGVYPGLITDWSKILRYVIYVAVPLLIIIFAVIVWVRLLRREVAMRTQELRESKETLQNILNSVVFGIMIIGKDKKIYRSNTTATKMCGYKDEEEIVGKTCHDVLCPDMVDKCPLLDLGKTADTSDRILYTRDGRRIPIHKSVTTITLQGKKYLLESFIDITEQKKAEEQIKRNLKEKEILLRELYHRTKNNMQVISAFMHLRIRHIQDESVKEIFQDLETKISSMALVHKSLYESEDLSKINLKDYYHSLIELIRETYEMPEKKIDILLTGDDTPVLIDVAMPLGLILNELVTNSLKHAFSDRTEGRIDIHIEAGESTITLLYSDNGPGLPKGFDVKKDSKLGLETVRALVEQQLMGKMEIENNNGVLFRFTFTETLYHPRI
jgi:PAS domain S-box-containing protein